MEKLFDETAYYRTITMIMGEYPEYGYFLSNLNWEFTDKIPTAAVCLQGTKLSLWINKDFMSSLQIDPKPGIPGAERIHEPGGIMIHELGHIIEGHLFVNYPNRKIGNIATDLWLNQHTEKHFNIPRIGDHAGLTITDEQWKPFNFPLAPRGSTSEYYDILMKNQDKLPQDVEPQWGFVVLDEAGNPTELTGEMKDAVEASVKATVLDILKSCPAGTGSKLIKESLWLKPKVSIIPWNREFRKWASSSVSTDSRPTRSRPNRFNDEQYGTRIKLKQRLLVMLDVSGSVDNEALLEGFSEIHAIYKKGFEVDVIQVDTKLLSHETYKGNWAGTTRNGSGGTCLEAGVEFYLKDKYDGLICFTDGEFSPTQLYKHRKCHNSLWVHYPNCQINQQLPGRSLQMN